MAQQMSQPRSAVTSPRGQMRLAAGAVALLLSPLAWWAATSADWGDLGWLIPVTVMVSLILGFVLTRAGVRPGGPLAVTAGAFFSVLVALFTTILSAVDSDLVRVLVALVPAVLLAALVATGVQEAAADLEGEWIVAAGVVILAVLVSVLLVKVQVSVQTIEHAKTALPHLF